jgi:hypothetical protein
MTTTPPPGTLQIELWDYGDNEPVVGNTSIDSGTQYIELGDRGINGGTVSASVSLSLLGGKRQYHVRRFIAGTALEIPSNTILTIDNYYAIVLRYVDTDVTVYGSEPSFSKNYYNNGFAFTSPDDSTAVTKIGEYNDIQFNIYSTQEVWLNTLLKFYDSTPGNNASESTYIEDKNMNICGVISVENTPEQSILAEFKDRLFCLPKGGKFEVNLNDDGTDNTTQINVLIGYIYAPEEVNG